MSSDDVYINNAQHCRTLATWARSECVKELFLELAELWDQLTADKQFLAGLATRQKHAEIGQTEIQARTRPERQL